MSFPIKNGEVQMPPPSVSSVLSNGSKGDAVKQLQNGLNKLGFELPPLSLRLEVGDS